MIDVGSHRSRFPSPEPWIPEKILSRGIESLAGGIALQQRSTAEDDCANIIPRVQRVGKRRRHACRARRGLSRVLGVDCDRDQATGSAWARELGSVCETVTAAPASQKNSQPSVIELNTTAVIQLMAIPIAASHSVMPIRRSVNVVPLR